MFPSLLVLLAAAFSSAVAADWESLGATHWVNNQTGNDETGDGSEERPYATINKAASIMAQDDIVKIVPGKPYVLTEMITNATAFTTSPEYAHLTFTSSTDERVIIDGNGKCRGMLIGGRGLYFKNLCFTNCVGSVIGNGVALGLGNADYGWGSDLEMWRLGIRVQNCGFYCCTNNYDEADSKSSSPAAFFAKKIIVENCDFAYCHAGAYGGAVYSYNSCYEYFTNCTFFGNTAYLQGGAMLSSGGGSYTKLIDCSFTSNSIRKCVNNDGFCTGGALYGRYVLIDRCSFTNNYAYGGGGALYSRAGATHIRNTSFFGNQAQGLHWYPGGGAVYFWDGGSISNCWFESNSIPSASGGGVYAKGADFAMQDCTFTNNSASSAGAYYDNGSGNPELPRTSRVERVRFLCNKATGFGGAYYSQPAPLTSRVNLRNCLFAGNSGKQGGAVAMHHWSTKMDGGSCESCTFVGNTASSAGGAIYMNYSDYAVTNCLFSGNYKGTTLNDTSVATSSTIDLDHCHMSADGDPKFANATAGDYTLLRTSPCVNAGVELGWMANGTDLRGKLRIKPAYLGGGVDLGCYAYWTGPGLMLFLE